MGANLTDRTVKAAGPGKHQDGTVPGLSLLVWPSGSRSWVLRYQLRGRRREMGLGPYPEVTLAMARDRALAARRTVKAEGRDPLVERQRVTALSFKAAAEALIESKRPGWRNAKHGAQWAATLSAYAYPSLGDQDVAAIDTAAVVAVLRPIWASKPETASRVRQRIEAVLGYATTLGRRSGDNPARWKNHLDNLLAAPGKVRAVQHHAALDWRHLPAFMVELASREGIAAKALAFAIHTVARSGEVRGLVWAEIDEVASVWVVPAARTKSGKEHRVPLTPAARSLLGAPGESDALLFPSPSDPAKQLSDMTLTAVLRRMGRGDLTVHGFRSSFRDWAGEATTHPREVIEAALAHRLKNKSEAAYARGDLFTKRRKLMHDWAAFILQPQPATVVDLTGLLTERGDVTWQFGGAR